MCFAFRTTTSSEDQNLDELPIMTKMTSGSNARRPAAQSPPAPVRASPRSSRAASDDCFEVAARKVARSTSSRAHDSGQRGSTVDSTRTKDLDDGDDDEGSEDDEYQDVDESTTTNGNNRKRPGSSLVKGAAKKAKTGAVYQRPTPSGKGDDYDDLCYRANVVSRNLRETVNQLTSEVNEAKQERDEAVVTASVLRKKLKSERAIEAIKEVKHEADLKTAVQEMRANLKAEMEAKHRSSNQAKDRKHKEEQARSKDRVEEAQATMKEAKAAAKDLRPEHSSLLQKRDKKIENLKATKVTLEGACDKLRSDKGKLEAEKDGLSKALSHKSDEIWELQHQIKNLESEVVKEKAVSASFRFGMDRQDREHAANKRVWEQKWQIQYDNAQKSALRASEVQRSLHPTACALNESIINRDKFEAKLKDAEAEVLSLRNSISKGSGFDQVVKGE